MTTLRSGALAAVLLLGGCAWVLPKPSPAESAGTESSCRLDLAAARQAALHRVSARGAPVPAIIVRADGPSADRTIRNGTRVILRDGSVPDPRQPAPGAETAPLTLTAESLNGSGTDPVEIFDEMVIRLRSASGGPAAAAPAGVSAAGEDFVIFKADVPDPNRPTTCDRTLRDGDFVYLRTVQPSAWVRIEGGALAGAAPTAPSRPCTAQQQRCYTDRYGGLVCVQAGACDGAAARSADAASR